MRRFVIKPILHIFLRMYRLLKHTGVKVVRQINIASITVEIRLCFT